MIESLTLRRRARWTRLTYGLLAVAAVVLLVIDRPGEKTSVFNSLRANADDIAAPVMGAVAAPFSALRSVGQSMDRHWAVAEENERLRAQIAELQAWRELALSLRDQVSAYEAILDIPGVESADPIVGWTVAESGGQFQHARLLGIGASKGLKEGYPVLNDRGLVGRLISVGDRSSRVLLLEDASSRVPVMTEDGEVRAVLVGDNRSAPRLDFQGGSRSLDEGDRIVTSGDTGLFPRALPVGQAAPAGDGEWRVALYSESQPIDAVWIYPYEMAPPPPPEARTPVPPGALLEEPAAESGEADAAGAGDSEAADDGAQDAEASPSAVQQANNAPGDETPQ